MIILRKITSVFLIATITLSMTSTIFAEDINVSSGVNSDTTVETNGNTSIELGDSNNVVEVDASENNKSETEDNTYDSINNSGVNDNLSIDTETNKQDGILDIGDEEWYKDILPDKTKIPSNIPSNIDDTLRKKIISMALSKKQTQPETDNYTHKDDRANAFSVTVPSSLPVILTADGEAVTSNEAKITNRSKRPVEITNVTISGSSDCTLMDYDTFKPAKEEINSKKVALRINDVKSTGHNTSNYHNGIFKQLGKGSVSDGSNVIELDYDLLSQASTLGTSMAMADIVFTFDWAGVESCDVALPSIYYESGVGNNVSVGEKITLSTSSDIVGGKWVSSNSDIISVDENTGEISVLKEGESTITYSDAASSGELTLKAKDYTMYYSIGVEEIDPDYDVPDWYVPPTILKLNEDFSHALKFIYTEDTYCDWKKYEPLPKFPIVYNGAYVESLANTFANSGAYDYLDLSAWDVSHVKNFSMFAENHGLRKIITTGWDTSNMMVMPSFEGHSSSMGDDSIVGLEDWNLDNVISLYGLYSEKITPEFYYNFIVNRLDMSKIESMTSMFYFYVDGTDDVFGETVNGFDIGERLRESGFSTDSLIDTTLMFYFMTALGKPVDISLYDFTKIENDTLMFLFCYATFIVKDQANKEALESYRDNTIRLVEGMSDDEDFNPEEYVQVKFYTVDEYNALMLDKQQQQKPVDTIPQPQDQQVPQDGLKPQELPQEQVPQEQVPQEQLPQESPQDEQQEQPQEDTEEPQEEPQEDSQSQESTQEQTGSF